MNRSEETLVEEVAGDTCGDAYVAGAEAGREGMRGNVLASAHQVIAEPFDDIERIRKLQVRVESAIQDAVIDRLAMAGDVRDQRHDRLLELSEYGRELGGSHTGLAAVDEGVIRLVLVAECVGYAAVELDVLLEIGREQGEVLVVPGLLPHGPGHRTRARDLGDQVGGKLASLVVVAPGDAHDAGLVGLESKSRDLVLQ